MIGALEAGGTKMVCAIADEEKKLIDRVEIPTRTPEQTMPELIHYFERYNIEALGIGTFGPVVLDCNSPDHGMITTTPKKEWRNYNIKTAFENALHIPVGIDTDVNTAILGEVLYGSCKGLENCIYITIGTGIGVGIYVNGKLLHGMMHPEGGHILLQKQLEDAYEGKCKRHPNCFEGLASGPALEGRYHKKAEELSNKEEVWKLEASYIAQALVNYSLILSPQRIVLGGGVMHQRQLYDLVRDKFSEYMNGYVNCGSLDQYIVEPELKNDQAIYGCFSIAKEAKNLTGESSVKSLTNTPFLNLFEMQAKARDGLDFNYYFASRNDVKKVKCVTGKNDPEGMVIYALCKDDPGKIVLLHQYRYPLGRYLYELPAGLIDANETVNEAAIREMKEETGLDLIIYEGGSEIFRRPYYMAQGLTDESTVIVFGYVSGEINKEGNENTERIDVMFVDKDDIKELMDKEEMSVRCGYLMMSFLKSAKESPFEFLNL